MEGLWGRSMNLSIYLILFPRLTPGPCGPLAQVRLALGPRGPPLGVFSLGMFAPAKTQIVTGELKADSKADSAAVADGSDARGGSQDSTHSDATLPFPFCG